MRRKARKGDVAAWKHKHTPYLAALIFTFALVAIIYVLDYVNIGLEKGFGYSSIIFASFGASGFILFMMPGTYAARKGVFVKSYFIGGVIGYIGYVLIGILGFYASAAIVLLFVALLLHVTESEHPPAVALAFAFVLFNVGAVGIFIAIFGVFLLLAAKAAEELIIRILG